MAKTKTQPVPKPKAPKTKPAPKPVEEWQIASLSAKVADQNRLLRSDLNTISANATQLFDSVRSLTGIVGKVIGLLEKTPPTGAASVPGAPADAVADPSLLAAARDCDPQALLMLAARHRKRGLAADATGWGEPDERIAYELEAFAFEVQGRHLEAKKLRRLLELSGWTTTRVSPSSRGMLTDLRAYADGNGLPVTVLPARWDASAAPDDERAVHGWGEGIASPDGFLLLSPTDGAHEGWTRSALLALFRSAFPEIQFRVKFLNNSASWAGEAARFVLGLTM